MKKRDKNIKIISAFCISYGMWAFLYNIKSLYVLLVTFFPLIALIGIPKVFVSLLFSLILPIAYVSCGIGLLKGKRLAVPILICSMLMVVVLDMTSLFIGIRNSLFLERTIMPSNSEDMTSVFVSTKWLNLLMMVHFGFFLYLIKNVRRSE